MRDFTHSLVTNVGSIFFAECEKNADAKFIFLLFLLTAHACTGQMSIRPEPCALRITTRR
jgi:hypothetical protein